MVPHRPACRKHKNPRPRSVWQDLLVGQLSPRPKTVPQTSMQEANMSTSKTSHTFSSAHVRQDLGVCQSQLRVPKLLQPQSITCACFPSTCAMSPPEEPTCASVTRQNGKHRINKPLRTQCIVCACVSLTSAANPPERLTR